MTEEEKRDVVLNDSDVLEGNSIDSTMSDNMEVLETDSLVSSEIEGLSSALEDELSSSLDESVEPETEFSLSEKNNMSESVDASTIFNFDSSVPETTFTPTEDTSVLKSDNADTMFAFTEESTPLSVEVSGSNPFMYDFESKQETNSSENGPDNAQQSQIENSFSYVEPVNPSQYVDTSANFTYDVAQSAQSSLTDENNDTYEYSEPSLDASGSVQQASNEKYNPKVNFSQENRSEEKSSLGFMVLFGIIMLIIVLVLPYFVGYN